MKTKNVITISATILVLLSGIAEADISDTIEKSYAFDSAGKVSISNINGDVTIEACDCTQLKFSAHITASDQETRDSISLKIKASQSSFSVETKYAKRDKTWRGKDRHSEVVYHLSVPNNANLHGIELVNGDLNIAGVTGRLEAELVNGELKSDGLTSDTKISVVNGDIELTFKNLDNAKRVDLESVNGSIIVSLPSDASAKISAETVSGRISNEFGLKVNKGQWVGSDMSGTIGDGKVVIDMENVNGKIWLKRQ